MTCCSGSSFVPAPDATLDPSQRVNFTFGMVLGVDDFRQEHLYLAARDQRALAATIGYGVVAGLEVGCNTPDGGKTTVRVEPGLALLPDGHLVAVTGAQCATLDDWLEQQKDRPERVYVVLGFTERSGTPVPIPDEPCRAESELQADSRISDGFVIDFASDPPDNREDEALRSFAAWLRTIEVVGGPDDDGQDERSDLLRQRVDEAGGRRQEFARAEATDRGRLERFLQAVEKAIGQAIARGWPAKTLRPASEPPLPAGSGDLLIPYANYAQYLSAAFALWVDRLRWRYLEQHYEQPPLVDGRLLLAGIDLGGGKPAAALHGRPQIVHLRLLQEWLLNHADEAPRSAHYVLGRSDPRLPAAQDLHAAFAAAGNRRLARIDAVGGDGVVRPAVVWPGSTANPADYYGPGMDAPIPASDGGTGQSAPAPGQLLVGAPASSPPAAPAFALGRLRAALHGEGDPPAANLRVDTFTEAPDIVLDTVQDIDAAASPAFAGLTVSGAVAAGSLLVAANERSDGTLTVSALDSAIVGSNADGCFVKASRWDGDEEGLRAAKLYYYAPGQEQPVRIEDGGSGLADRPQPLQVLVGHNGDAPAAYVLANLVAGNNVSLTLSQALAPVTGPQPSDGLPNLGGRPPATVPLPLGDRPGVGARLDGLATGKRQTEWNLQIDARGGSDLTLPLTVAQGGTGLTATPAIGQILLGDGSGFVLGQVVGGNSGRNLTVSATSAGVTLDTVQRIDSEATPTFAALRLGSPSERPATHNLGWNRDGGEVVIGPLASIGRRLLIVDDPDQLARLLDGFKELAANDVVIVYRSDKDYAGDNVPAPDNEGQLLTLKTLAGAGSVTLEGGLLEGGSVRLTAGRAITLVASPQLEQWLTIGRS